MTKFLKSLSLLLIFFPALVISSCSMIDPQSEDMMDPMEMDPQDTTAILEKAPDFSLLSISGATVSLDDFAGKPVVIFFFGNTCPLCIGIGPKIQSDIREQFTNDELAMIGIDVWNGNQASVLNFKDRTGVTFDLLLEGSAVALAYQTTYDRLFVLNEKGEFIHKGASSASNDINNVVQAVQGLL